MSADRIDTSPETIAALLDELRTIGCHENGDARCTCGIGQNAADLIQALTAERDDARAAADEITELRRRLGGGCEANNGGDHTVISEGRYKFCGECGESLIGIRYCHVPRESR